MATDIEYISADGLKALRDELRQLVSVDRAEMATRIAEAVTLGDLSENADYEDAKRQQAFLEGRIATIEQLLRNAVVIESGGQTAKVDVGSRVTIVTSDGKETYTIVGSHEAKPSEGRISHESPVGAAMMGHGVGDKIKAHTPGGEFAFEIKAIA